MLSQSPRVYAVPGAKQVFRESGTTQAAAARAAGLNRTVLSEWIGGTRELRRDQVAVLAHVLGVPLEQIAEDGLRCPSCKARTGMGIAA